MNKHRPIIQKVFLVGAIAKLGATVTTYPLQVVKVNRPIVPSFSPHLLFVIKKKSHQVIISY